MLKNLFNYFSNVVPQQAFPSLLTLVSIPAVNIQQKPDSSSSDINHISNKLNIDDEHYDSYHLHPSTNSSKDPNLEITPQDVHQASFSNPLTTAPLSSKSLNNVFELLQVICISRHGLRTPLKSNSSLTNLDWQCLSSEETLDIFSMRMQLYHIPSMRKFGFDYYNPNLRGLILHNNFLTEDEDKTKYGNCTSGRLTKLGHQQMRIVGLQIRNRYFNELGFLDSSWIPENNYIRSSNTQRTIESAYEIIQGMYPSGYSSPLRIDLYSENENLYPSLSCSALKQLYQQFNKSAEVSKLKLETKKLFNNEDFSSTHSYNEWSKHQPPGLCNILSSLVGHNLPLPQGITTEHALKICDLSNKYYQALMKNPQVSRLGIGMLLGEIVEHLERQILLDRSMSIHGTHKPDLLNHPKFILLSGHDNTLIPLLNILSPSHLEHVPMGSIITIELWKRRKDHSSDHGDDQEYYINFVYNLKSRAISECDNQIPCPWYKFLELSKKNIPNNYDSECRLNS